MLGRLLLPVALAATADAAVLTHDIPVINPSHGAPASFSPETRIELGIRGDYKPWVVELATGELLMVHRCQQPEPECWVLPGTVGPYAFHVVMWRAPANWTSAADWVRTQHVPRSGENDPTHPALSSGQPPSASGIERWGRRQLLAPGGAEGPAAVAGAARGERP